MARQNPWTKNVDKGHQAFNYVTSLGSCTGFCVDKHPTKRFYVDWIAKMSESETAS